MTETVLRAAAVLMGVYAVIIFGLFGAALIRGLRWKEHTRQTAVLLPQIRASLVDYLAGKEDLEPLRRFLRIGRGDVLTAILSFQNAVSGSARDRLCGLTIDLELLDEWRREIRSRDVMRRRAAFAVISFVYAYEPCRRAVGDLLLDSLEDRDEEVRVCSAQALARFGSPAEVVVIFRIAARGSLLTRILLAGPLRPHALELAVVAVPEELRSDDVTRILATLQIVVAWERALPLAGLGELMLHPEREIRIQALRAAPLVTASRENELAVIQSLADPDPEIAMAAAAVVGRLRIKEAIPSLVQCLSSGNAALARTAAAALAALPPLGWQTLEELAASGESTTVSLVAADVLRRVRPAESK
jgi:HEAT repeat protein